MSTEKITKSFLFYVVPLCLLLSYIFSTCYGADLDELDNRITEVEDQVKAIQKRIDEGFVVKEIQPGNDPTTGRPGIRITFINPQGEEKTEWVVNGATGEAGVNGTNGTNGTTWTIQGTPPTWWSTDQGGTATNTGIPAAGSKSPEPKGGFWNFYSWNEQENKYDTIQSNILADSLASYVVDLGDHYELYIPMQVLENGVPVVPPAFTMQQIRLPKWLQESNPPVVFKILGFAEKTATDTVRLLGDVEFNYWYIEHISVARDSSMWQWDYYPSKGEMEEGEYIIPQLKNTTRNIGVVFSINRSKEYITNSGLSFGLYDSKGQKLNVIKLDSPIDFDDGLITKAGSNGDTVYYARMQEESFRSVPVPLSNIPKGKIYYRMIVEDATTIKSELAPYTINLSRSTISSALKVIEVAGAGALPPGMDTFVVTASTTFFNPIGIENLDSVYDYYLDSLSLPRVTFGKTGADTNFKTFKVDSPATGEADYAFKLNVYILQMDGVISLDTINIKAVP
jgi:hypothetical protein